MTDIVLVTILSADTVGLVATIADHLFAAGVNLRDTNFAAIGRGGKFTSVCELPVGLTATELGDQLRREPGLRGAEIAVAPYRFDPVHGPETQVTHEVVVMGGDQLGLIARLSDVFAQYGANIVRLDAQKLGPAEGDAFYTRFAVRLDPAQAEKCLATVANTAGSLRLACRVSAGDGKPG